MIYKIDLIAWTAISFLTATATATALECPPMPQQASKDTLIALNIAFLKLGPLNWVLSTAELHRWHHSTKPEEGNSNYGSNLVLWDLLFGTRFLPREHPPVELGLSDMPNFPRRFWGQLLSPFRWAKLKG